ncbi:MAG: hypothetical protein QM775_00035 [Pirellulales bacterium]
MRRAKISIIGAGNVGATAPTGAPPPNSATWFSWMFRKPKACRRARRST